MPVAKFIVICEGVSHSCDVTVSMASPGMMGKRDCWALVLPDAGELSADDERVLLITVIRFHMLPSTKSV